MKLTRVQSCIKGILGEAGGEDVNTLLKEVLAALNLGPSQIVRVCEEIGDLIDRGLIALVEAGSPGALYQPELSPEETDDALQVFRWLNFAEDGSWCYSYRRNGETLLLYVIDTGLVASP